MEILPNSDKINIEKISFATPGYLLGKKRVTSKRSDLARIEMGEKKGCIERQVVECGK
jgi:hypothetical protein